MMQPLARNGGNAGVRGCSSMAEQKLPKLHTSADFRLPARKTSAQEAVSFQYDGFSQQNELASAFGGHAKAETTRFFAARSGFVGGNIARNGGGYSAVGRTGVGR